jgi:hypothetical protein
VTGDRLVFAARRWFAWRVYSMPILEVKDVRWKRRLLFDQLEVSTSTGFLRFNVFKSGIPAAHAARPLPVRQ